MKKGNSSRTNKPQQGLQAFERLGRPAHFKGATEKRIASAKTF